MNNKDILLWEIIAIIHTFGGSIMIGVGSQGIISYNTAFIGVVLFFINFLMIFIGIKAEGKNKYCTQTITFITALVTIFFLLLALLNFDIQFVSVIT